jgi:hypothetical protein
VFAHACKLGWKASCRNGPSMHLGRDAAQDEPAAPRGPAPTSRLPRARGASRKNCTLTLTRRCRHDCEMQIARRL